MRIRPTNNDCATVIPPLKRWADATPTHILRSPFGARGQPDLETRQRRQWRFAPLTRLDCHDGAAEALASRRGGFGMVTSQSQMAYATGMGFGRTVWIAAIAAAGCAPSSAPPSAFSAQPTAALSEAAATDPPRIMSATATPGAADLHVLAAGSIGMGAHDSASATVSHDAAASQTSDATSSPSRQPDSSVLRSGWDRSQACQDYRKATRSRPPAPREWIDKCFAPGGGVHPMAECEEVVFTTLERRMLDGTATVHELRIIKAMCRHSRDARCIACAESGIP